MAAYEAQRADEARQKAQAEAAPGTMPGESPPAEQGGAQGQEQDAPFTVMSTMLSLATDLLKRKRTTVRLLRAA